jgi:hypothetical protein
LSILNEDVALIFDLNLIQFESFGHLHCQLPQKKNIIIHCIQLHHPSSNKVQNIQLDQYDETAINLIKIPRKYAQA